MMMMTMCLYVCEGLLQVSSRLDDVTVTPAVYSLCITASDGLHNTTVPFNISLSDSDHQHGGPDVEFSQSFYVFDVSEDARPGVRVGRVQASTSSSSASLSYVIASRYASSVFSVNATYGILTLASALDYETVSYMYYVDNVSAQCRRVMRSSVCPMFEILS